MNLPLISSKTRAFASVRIGIVIFIAMLLAVAAYNIPAINPGLMRQSIAVATLTFLIFLGYMIGVTIAAGVGIAFAVASFASGEQQPAAAVAGLAINAGILLFIAARFFFG